MDTSIDFYFCNASKSGSQIHCVQTGYDFPTVLKVVLIKALWQMFLEVPVRHEKSS